MQNALSVPTLQALRYWDLTQACCSQSPPKAKHRYVFILYPQHGRVNAKAPKAHHNFTLHQFEKVSCTLAYWLSQTPHQLPFAQELMVGETHKQMQSPVIILCMGCRSTILEILLT